MIQQTQTIQEDLISKLNSKQEESKTQDSSFSSLVGFDKIKDTIISSGKYVNHTMLQVLQTDISYLLSQVTSKGFSNEQKQFIVENEEQLDSIDKKKKADERAFKKKTQECSKRAKERKENEMKEQFGDYMEEDQIIIKVGQLQGQKLNEAIEEQNNWQCIDYMMCQQCSQSNKYQAQYLLDVQAYLNDQYNLIRQEKFEEANKSIISSIYKGTFNIKNVPEILMKHKGKIGLYQAKDMTLEQLLSDSKLTYQFTQLQNNIEFPSDQKCPILSEIQKIIAEQNKPENQILKGGVFGQGISIQQFCEQDKQKNLEYYQYLDSRVKKGIKLYGANNSYYQYVYALIKVTQ